MIKNTSSQESNTRKIEIVDGKIIYTLKLDGVQDYLTYNQTLYEILCLDRLKPFRDDGRLRIKIYHHRTDQNMYLYDLAIACYMGMVNTATFLEDMQGYFEFKERYRLSVDHLDNHIRNNTMLNLSLMKRTTNSQKSDITARVEKPSVIVACYVNGRYLVHYESHNVTCGLMVGVLNRLLGGSGKPLIIGNPEFDVLQRFICEDAETFVKCLNSIVDRRITFMGKDIALPMRDNRRKWRSNNSGSYTENVLESIKAQEVVASNPIEAFQLFE